MNEPTTGVQPGGQVTGRPAPARPDPGAGGAAAAPAVRRVRWFRQVVVPLLLLAVLLVGAFLPGLWLWADLDPTPVFKMGMFGMWAVVLSLVLLPLWFFAFSGFRARTRLLGLAVLVVLVGTAAACIAELDVDGNVRPYVQRWRWQEPAEDRLARHRSQQEASTGPRPAVDLTPDPERDFPRYRGARGDGVVHGLKLATDWGSHPPKLLWRQPGGGGFAGFAVAGNVAITAEQRKDQEVVVCYDRAGGHELWKYSYPALFRDPSGNGPRATPTIAGDHVYSLGGLGKLVCLDGRTGKLVWSRDTLEDAGAKVVTWGMTSSPLVTDDLVIVNPGIDPDNNKERALTAYRRGDGEPVWAAGQYKAGYSSPQLARLAGRDQVLLFDAGGLAGFDLKTGKELWRHPWETFQDMNIIQPVLLGGDRVFLSSETSNGCAVLKVVADGKNFKIEEVWANKFLCSKFANPVVGGGFIYGLSNGTLVCLDEETGRRRWRGKYYGHGQLLLVGGVLLVSSERGYVALVAAGPEKYQELARLEVFGEKTWNTPALAGRQLFLRNHQEMACFELPVAE
jgi:outer membrane protein assembly factor BamB